MGALTAPRRAGLEAGEGTSCLAGVEGLRRRAGTEVVAEGRRWELSKVAEEERPGLWPEGAEGLSCVEGGEAEGALPSKVAEVAVLAFVVHF